jgi:hypothetical protein
MRVSPWVFRPPEEKDWLLKLQKKEIFMFWDQFQAQLIHDKMVHVVSAAAVAVWTDRIIITIIHLLGLAPAGSWLHRTAGMATYRGGAVRNPL